MRENKACLQKELEKMSTAQLDVILHEELQKEHPDEKTVLPILEVLGERESGEPIVIAESAKAAWAKFQESTAASRPRRSPVKWLASVAAAIAIVFAVLLAIPQETEADTLLDRLIHLTDSVIQFFDPDRDPGDLQREFVFETDHPGLQQLYDEVVKLGVTGPVVPMWLPEGYELTELKTSSGRGYEKVYAVFSNGAKNLTIQYKLVAGTTSAQYEIKSKQVEVYESSGIYHTIIENEKDLSVIWEGKTVDCLMVADLEKEVLYAIIDSIYRRNTQ